jgi:phage FluMu gp28-like protein
MRRACLDATGLGMQLAEEAQIKFGKFKVEQVMFTGKSKEEMAYELYTGVEDARIIIPQNKEIREDLHRVRKVTTAANNIRFDVEKSEVSGHADRFWSLALASHAAGNKNNGPVFVASAGRRAISSLTQRY